MRASIVRGKTDTPDTGRAIDRDIESLVLSSALFTSPLSKYLPRTPSILRILSSGSSKISYRVYIDE